MRKNPGRRERRSSERQLKKKGNLNQKSKHKMRVHMGSRDYM